MSKADSKVHLSQNAHPNLFFIQFLLKEVYGHDDKWLLFGFKS